LASLEDNTGQHLVDRKSKGVDACPSAWDIMLWGKQMVAWGSDKQVMVALGDWLWASLESLAVGLA